jgi:hypothetical protein
VAGLIAMLGLFVGVSLVRAAIIGMDALTTVIAILGYIVLMSACILGALAYDRRRSRQLGNTSDPHGSA